MVKDEIVGEVLKAYISLSEKYKDKVSKEFVKRYCRKRLSPHKVPKYIKFVGSIPVNSSGKKVRSLIAKIKD